jgi:hypothetical protein
MEEELLEGWGGFILFKHTWEATTASPTKVSRTSPVMMTTMATIKGYIPQRAKAIEAQVIVANYYYDLQATGSGTPLPTHSDEDARGEQRGLAEEGER